MRFVWVQIPVDSYGILVLRARAIRATVLRAPAMPDEIVSKMKEGYDSFRNIIEREAFFAQWTDEERSKIPQNLQEQIYNKYVVKAQMLQRDNFTCQNTECKFPDSPLTMHHVKFQTNGGQDKVRNVVTLCKTCHTRFHRAKAGITLADRPEFAAHIRGMTFKLEAPEPSKDWKKLKHEMGELRSRLKRQGMRAVISWEDVYILMRWLFDMDADNVDDD